MADTKNPEIILDRCVLRPGEQLYAAYVWAELVARCVQLKDSDCETPYRINSVVGGPVTAEAVDLLGSDTVMVRFQRLQQVKVQIERINGRDGLTRYMPSLVEVTDYPVMSDDHRNMMLGQTKFLFDGDDRLHLLATLLPIMKQGTGDSQSATVAPT